MDLLRIIVLILMMIGITPIIYNFFKGNTMKWIALLFYQNQIYIETFLPTIICKQTFWICLESLINIT
jgi:hypothetical protein